MDEHNYIWVCTDCYFAHHYGWHEHEGQWYAGESDTPCEREPLSLWDERYDLWDATCSDHDARHTDTDEGGEWEPCTHCGREEHETGIDEFSWSPCNGCGSHLGGSRYRLSWAERKT